MDEVAEVGKSIHKARQSFANYMTEMTFLRRSDGTVPAFRRATKKVIYNFLSDLFDSHVCLPIHRLRQDEYIAASVVPSEIRYVITSMENCTPPHSYRIKSDHLKNLPPLIVGTLAGLFTRYLSECKVLTSWKTSKIVLLYKKGNLDDIGNYCPFAVYNLQAFTRVVLWRIDRILDEGQPCKQAGFWRGFSIIDHIHFIHHARLIEVSREYKMPLCLTLIDLEEAFDTVEAEAVNEARGN